MNNTTLIKKLKALHVPKNTSLPVLKKVLIECKNDVLHFTTTDLDTQTSFHVPFDYAGFTALVDHKELISILSSLPKNTEVDFIMNDKFEITSEYGSFKMVSDSIEAYPALWDTPETNCEVDSSIAGKLLDILPFVADKTEIRASLTGVFYDKETKHLVGTNGHYMGYYKNIENLFNDNAIIPRDAIKILNKMMKASDYYGKKSPEKLTTGRNYKGNQLSFSGLDFTIITRVVEGPYPPYYKVIPTNYTEIMELNADKIKLIPLKMLNKNTHQIMLKSVNSKVVLHGENSDSPTIWEMEAGITTYDENMAFNADLLKTVCKFVGKNPVLIDVTDSRTAVKYEDADKLALLMPVRLPDTEEQ